MAMTERTKVSPDPQGLLKCRQLLHEIDRAVTLVRTTKIQKLELSASEGLPRAVVYRIGNAQVRIDLFYTDTEARHD